MASPPSRTVPPAKPTSSPYPVDENGRAIIPPPVFAKPQQTLTDTLPWGNMPLHKQPCFTKSAVWGLATGGAFGAHRYVTKKAMFPAVNGAVFMFAATISVSWFFCRRAREKEHALYKQRLLNEVHGRADAARRRKLERQRQQ